MKIKILLTGKFSAVNAWLKMLAERELAVN
jgi:cell division inhibitor SulA